MERLKSKTTLLVALVLAAVLAMTGIGYALGAPDSRNMEMKVNKAYTAMENNRDEIFQYLDGLGVDSASGTKYGSYSQAYTSDNPNIDVSYNGNTLYVGTWVDISTHAADLDSLYSLFANNGATHMSFMVYATVGHRLSVDFNDGSTLVIEGNEEFSNDSLGVSTVDADDNYYDMYTFQYNEDTWELESITVNPESAFKTLQPITPIFDFHFKATGIQATGFNDYKEAFAALNN